jgi:hypothetical protein
MHRNYGRRLEKRHPAHDPWHRGSNKAYIVYRIDADHADWGTVKMSEVAIQEWSNGKVVREKFVY